MLMVLLQVSNFQFECTYIRLGGDWSDCDVVAHLVEKRKLSPVCRLVCEQVGEESQSLLSLFPSA